ncbi:MAG: hypothetical protein K2F59_05525, partial [Eubacteriales bacterium]|nr:hypothetical protein [Eubacteriales bacterium]
YEYEYYEGELTISKIINRKSRKIIGRFDIDKISKVSKPDNADKSIKIINACLKKISNNNNKELIIFVGGNEPVGYYLSIDEKLFEILKRKKPSIFNYI